MLVLLRLLACGREDEPAKESAEPNCLEVEDAAYDGSAPTFRVDRQFSASLLVEVQGGGALWDFGMFDPYGKWLEESCLPGKGAHCHRVCGDATTPLDCVADPKDMTESSTLFCTLRMWTGGDDPYTYYIGRIDGSWCGVGGPDRDQYDAMGCDPYFQ